LYQRVTDQIVAALEAGTPPWVKPWKAGSGTATSLPLNAVSRRPYSGINILMLWGTGAACGYSSPA
jgi:antirestriction protein ArdC